MLEERGEKISVHYEMTKEISCPAKIKTRFLLNMSDVLLLT